ncbi:MAG: hypothetical protein B6I38_03300 [Anaerolineaceae bacterium 4572_5.1]|nr:MAG: hypothetical protein B6I38_03300 [Anaerolineaceae bacterium 4572_5.1]
MKFKKRIYKNPSALWCDFKYVFARRPLIKKTMRGELISEAFRERLMLTVTEVNGCRYCHYFHASEALKAGISEEELKTFVDGTIPDNTPPEEYQALLYAQHWAENDAQPDLALAEKLHETYGEETAAAIHLILRMIRVGNLLGNTWDYFLFRISCGRWGKPDNNKNK